jgi:hypothetical protein
VIRAVTGHFTSVEQATMAAEELRQGGFQADVISQQQLDDGTVALTVLAGSRETEAIQIMSRHSPEAIEKQEGQEIGYISNAPREGDGAPVITEPADALRVRKRVAATPEEQSPFERRNLAQTTGQYYDMMRSQSDDGTVPPTVHREAVTAPPTADRDRTTPGAVTSSSRAPEVAAGAPPPTELRMPETPLQEFAARGSAETQSGTDRRQVMQARQMIEEPAPSPVIDTEQRAHADPQRARMEHERSAPMASTYERNAKLTDNPEPIFPRADAGAEPTDSNPVPISPTQPERRTSDGAQEPAPQPAVFAIPAGNQAGSGTSVAGMAGIGVIQNPDDPHKRVAHEQPGEESANPLKTALDR